MPSQEPQPLPPIIIGVAGGSGSGKTTVAERVREAAPGRTVEILNHDFNYPIATADVFHIIIEISQGNSAGKLCIIKCSRL